MPHRPGEVADGRGGEPQGRWSDDHVTGLVAALAFPERVARGRGDGTYLMVNGTRAEVRSGSALTGAEWIAVAVADRPVGAGHARVLLGGHIDGAASPGARPPRSTARGTRSPGTTGISSRGTWSGSVPWS